MVLYVLRYSYPYTTNPKITLKRETTVLIESSVDCRRFFNSGHASIFASGVVSSRGRGQASQDRHEHETSRDNAHLPGLPLVHL